MWLLCYFECVRFVDFCSLQCIPYSFGVCVSISVSLPSLSVAMLDTNRRCFYTNGPNAFFYMKRIVEYLKIIKWNFNLLGNRCKPYG